jgi:hypothetical protein
MMKRATLADEIEHGGRGDVGYWLSPADVMRVVAALRAAEREERKPR